MWIRWKAVSVGVLSGGAIAAVLYSSLAPGGAPLGASIPISELAPSVTYADCVPPAQLENGDCVTHLSVTRTVPPTQAPTPPDAMAAGARPAAAPAPAAPRAAAPANTAVPVVPPSPAATPVSAPAAVVSPSTQHEDDHTEDHPEDHTEDHTDDHPDDHPDEHHDEPGH